MADKRITTVDIMTAPDQNADYVLVVRGAQRDVRRLLLNSLPNEFDLHDDVATELTTLANIDRMLISDEGTPGAPNRWVKLTTLQSFFTNAFDLHDDVADELTAAADADRLLISDEDQAGDPQKWISILNLLNSRNVLRYEKLTAEFNIHGANQVINHSLGRVPQGYQLRLICKTAQAGYTAGDETFPVRLDTTSGSSGNRMSLAFVTEASESSIRVRSYVTGVTFVMNKTSGNATAVGDSNWKYGLTIWG